MSYDYKCLMRDISSIKNKYGIECRNAGQSLMDKKIPYLQIGCGDKKILLIGAHHGLEYLTSAFLMKFIDRYLQKLESQEEYYGHDIRQLSSKVSLYIIPMLNPDGVDIAVNGLDITNEYHRKLISMVGIHSFHEVWQSNARGVDINHNYDAGWKMTAKKQAPSLYGGEYPESEPETKAAVNFIKTVGIDMVIAFHSQGREIYYDFDGKEAQRSEEIAQKMAKESGYAVCRPTGTAVYGGCKDWFIKEFGREGFTIEIGLGKNPMPLSKIEEIYEENAKMILAAMEEI